MPNGLQSSTATSPRNANGSRLDLLAARCDAAIIRHSSTDARQADRRLLWPKRSAKLLRWPGWLLLISFLALLPLSARAELSKVQRQKLIEIRKEIKTAGARFKRQEFVAAGKSISKAQKSLGALATDVSKTDQQRLETTYRSLERAHALLELEGVSLTPLPKLEFTNAESDPKPLNRDGSGFTNSVAPILVAKCGRCHINDQKGQFSVASYVALMQGVPDAGPVVRPGDAQGSRLIEVIESGDMPRGGLVITAKERSTIESWINAGAKFDGDNPSSRIGTSATATPAEAPMAPTVASPTGSETISFSRDVASVLAEQCLGCHGGARTQNGLSLATFDTLLKGGDSGPIIDRKSPESSLLLTKLLGTGPGERMPLNRPPLPNDVIGKVKTWLTEGATFDGDSTSIGLQTVATLSFVSNATHAELAAERLRRARQNWALALSDDTPRTVETKNFLVVGGRGESELKQIAETAEDQTSTILRLLKSPNRRSLIKGRMTIFVMDRRYDYGEFGQMVEKRQLAKSLTGHWQHSLMDAYGVLLLPNATELSKAKLSAQIASIYVSSLGTDIPRWFATGMGQAVASQMFSRDGLVRTWNRPVEIGQQRPASLLSGKAPAEIAEPVWLAFSKQILRSGKFPQLRSNLSKPKSFGEAWQATFGASPEDVLQSYMARLSDR